MKDNKGFQFCVGLLVIVLAYKLWASGWISDVWGQKDPDAVESVDLVALFVGSAISAVQFVGVVALGLVAGLQPLAVSFMESLTSWRKSKPAEIDEQKLIDTLQGLSDRLDALEKVKHG